MIISEGINHGKLQTIIVGELKKAGLKHRLKKIILKNVKDNKTVFGAPLAKVPSCSVICCGSTLSVPIVVNEMSAILRGNAQMEGIFRKAGSQNRQKDIKRLLDSGGCVSEGHHPIDVASVLKLYLRTLPEPLISAEVQDLLLRCRLSAGDDALQSILHTLLLLPVLHVHLLHFIMELLHFISSKHTDNLMDSSNLAIVMAPSIMPLPVASSAQRLEHHVALVKIFIENAKQIGILSEDLMSQLDDDSQVYLARRKKRRSGSLNRVFHGLRKMVSGSVNTPATVRETGMTPVLSKSASKRKLDAIEGFSSKARKELKQNLQQKELSFTPMKFGMAEKKRLRLSQGDHKSTPVINSDYLHKNSETSMSSEDLLTSTENLFSAHDTIDLSPDMRQGDKDYVRISKQEYEEIKNRVSAIENRLSREFTEVVNVEALKQVQNVYEKTLEEAAILNCPTSDHLARRLSKELKIRPTEQAKIIRSPSARKIGNIRRRSQENVTKLVRHKSWNVPAQHSRPDMDRFYPYIATNRNNADNENLSPCKNKHWNGVDTNNSINNTDYTRKSCRNSCDNYKNNSQRVKTRSSLNSTVNSWEVTSEISINSSLNSSKKSQPTPTRHGYSSKQRTKSQKSPQGQQKWRSAAAFFMDKNGEIEGPGHSGRPSVNKLRRQNAGAVLAKTKLFESSSDRSSERNTEQPVHTGFARKPRISGNINTNTKANTKISAPSRTKCDGVAERRPTNAPLRPSRLVNEDIPPALPLKTYKQNVKHAPEGWQMDYRKIAPSPKKIASPPHSRHIQSTPVMKKILMPRALKSPAIGSETRKPNTPLRAIHTSPKRRSPRHKAQRGFIGGNNI